MSRLFGTDGVRGRFGVAPIDRPTVVGLGRALATLLQRGSLPGAVVVGGDGRRGTRRLYSWLCEGLGAGGVESVALGLMPTPAVAFSTVRLGAAAGVVLSASHNSHSDHGIKLFDREGFKWSPAQEQELEQLVEVGALEDEHSASWPAHTAAVDRYLEHLVASLPAGVDLSGLRLVIDAANGAASALAAPLVDRLGVAATLLSTAPDGENINRDCGSLHPQAAAARVVAESADLGLALDGDADRVLAIDELGRMLDGDALLFIWARHLLMRGELSPAKVVVTEMSNLGLEIALGGLGIEVVRCDVGDRQVVEAMRQSGAILGGEQSGHLVDLRLATTGDGLLSGLQLCGILAQSEEPLSGLRRGFEPLPQVLRNVSVRSKPPFSELPAVARVAEEARRRLGADGRLLLRYSGTEPLARIMMEGPEEGRLHAFAEEIAAEIERALA